MNTAATIRVLLIEDNADYARTVREMIAAGTGTPIELEHAARLDAGLERLATDGIDVVLLDVALPDSDGWDTFARVRARAPALPIIVLGEDDDDPLAHRIIHEGAQDYLVKTHVDAPLLGHAIRYAVERQRIEQHLAAERNLLRTLIDNVPDLLYAKDTAGRLIIGNLTHQRYFGADRPEDLIGKTVYDYFPRELADQYFNDEQTVMRTSEPLLNREEPRLTPDGRGSWVLTSKVPLRDDTGRIIGLVGITRDITALKQYEETLARERTLLRSLLDALPDHIFVKDTRGQFTTANVATARFLGVANPEALAGKTDADFFPREAAAHWHWEEQDLLRTGQTLVNREYDFRDQSGQTRWMLTTKVPLRDTHGTVIGLVGINRDITERKLAEKKLEAVNADLRRSHVELKAAQMQLIEAEKMQSVARLAAGVAHEVKNPLAILRMGMDYLRAHESAQQQDIVQILRDMDDALDRANAVIIGLLDFSAARELSLVEADVNTVIDQALRLVRHEIASADIDVIKHLAPGLPPLRLDPLKIQQVFINLFTNAAHAMAKGGTLIVRTYLKELEFHEVGRDAGDRSGERFRAGDTVLVAEVDDTGAGISDDRLSKVFDPFFTTKATGQGQGLGLTVSKKIIELHSGTIALRNRPEGGVRATVQFKAPRRS